MTDPSSTRIAHVQPLGPSDLAAWENLQETVSERMFGAFIDFKTGSQLRGYLDGSLGRAFGVFERGSLIAGALMRVPRHDAPLPARRFPMLTPGDFATRTAFLEGAMVTPSARGRGLQLALLYARRAEARQLGLHWLASGVRAANKVSWLNLLSGGMALVGCRENADGGEVLAMLGPVCDQQLPTDVSDYRFIHRDNHHALRKALRDGYLGVSLVFKDLIACERAKPAAGQA